MMQLYKTHWMLLMVVLGVIVMAVSCGDDDDDDNPVTPSSCGGIEVAGYCWYLGNEEESCDTVCANRGGCNAAGITYVGNQGSSATCETVLNALNAPADAMGDGTDEVWVGDSPGVETGCAVDSSGGIIDRVVYWPGTCSASDIDESRACACNQ
jgi:hypothetical protein